MKRPVLNSWSILLSVICILFLPYMAGAGTITIGSISDEPTEEIRNFLPLAGYLAKRLSSEGINRGKVIVAASVSQMADFLRKGKADLYIDSPFPSLAVSGLSGSRLVLRRWKKGIGEYHTVIFTRKDSGINRLKNIKGKIIAFEEPFSSSGYFLPMIALGQKGLQLLRKNLPSVLIAPDRVGYVFSNDNENTMVWVLRGKVSAGAMDNQSYVKEAGRSINSLKIIHRTYSIPRHIVSLRADLSLELASGIKELLINMDKSEEGRKALFDFEKTLKFDELPDGALTPLLESQKFINDEYGIQ